ncbi:endothelial cell-specific chemotaxis regulator isoform X2 [Scyliorhinus canicula]|uniref:endothelial cell-specific chemotaxis regulator isoform X2 n=1 Tax=Scyliorhinus canicula TaxID=7830 RepID=UPI0018F47F73|nr:endothelial cell-specific chemotaxis regulator isoform X2 [Scyliorhinus canicula]
MATFKVTVFLFFILFHVLKGSGRNVSTVSVTTNATNPTISTATMNKGETATVKTDDANSPVTRVETTSQDAGKMQSTATTPSSNTSMIDTSTIVLSAGTENFVSEMTTFAKNETKVNTSTAAQPPFTSVLSTVQGAYFITATSKTEVADPASGLEPSTAPAASGSSSLSVLAFVVIILILILVIVVVILVSVISVRFKCCDLEDASQGTRKARNAAPAESSQVNGEKESITLVSMRTLSTETGGQESSVQGSLQNDSIEAGEPDKHSQQINHAKV